jgi:inosine triphosphate pyrophosphatase
MLDGFEDRTAFAVCTFAYSSGPGEKISIFEGTTKGTIVPARGPNISYAPSSLTWIEPEGETQTFAEMEKIDKNKISHRFRALEKVKEFLSKINNL